MGANAPQSEALPPHLPPVRRKKLPKSAIFGKFLDFCPLRITFCPLDAPPQKISGAATAENRGLILTEPGTGFSFLPPPFFFSF